MKSKLYCPRQLQSCESTLRGRGDKTAPRTARIRGRKPIDLAMIRLGDTGTYRQLFRIRAGKLFALCLSKTLLHLPLNPYLRKRYLESGPMGVKFARIKCSVTNLSCSFSVQMAVLDSSSISVDNCRRPIVLPLAMFVPQLTARTRITAATPGMPQVTWTFCHPTLTASV